MTLIEIFLALVCHGGVCHVDRIYVTPEAMAVASCESGDGWNYGTYDFTARSLTDDGGAWQFNDATALWLTGQDHAETWSPAMQYANLVRLGMTAQGGDTGRRQSHAGVDGLTLWTTEQ